MARADYFDDIQNLYIAYYQRPADPEGLVYWADRLDAAGGDMTAIINAFATSAESTALYGDINSDTISDVVTDIYQALFGRAPESEGLNYYVNGFNAGTFTAGTIALDILNGAQNDDRLAINNKVEAAMQFTQVLDPDLDALELQGTYEGDADAQAGREFLAQVTHDPTTQYTDTALVEYIQTNIADTGDPILEQISGQTFTLTAGADAPESTAGNDTYVASEATLSSADVLDGGDGIDTLRYASSGAAAVSEAGFEASNIEIVQVTSDATGGTTFDVTGVSDLQTLRNFNSSEDLTLTGMNALPDVELVSVGSAGAGAPDPTPDTTLVFDAAVVAGSADELNLVLDTNLNVDGTGIGALTAQGIEVVNVTTQNGASIIDTIVSAQLETVNVVGDQDLTIQNNLVGATTIAAGTFTGNLSVVADSGAQDVEVTGGTGDDRADFSNAWDLNDAFDGGEGTDTLGLTYGVASTIAAANSGTATNVEILDVTTAANVNGTIDMDNFASVEKVIFNAGINTGVTATVDDAVTGLEVEVDVDAAATGNLVVDLKTDGAADELTITLDNIDAGDAIASIDAADAETLTISAKDVTVTGNGDVTITTLTAGDATTLNLSGDADITIGNTVDPATPVLAAINASTATGDVTISNTNTAAAGATITLGSGDDQLWVATSNGADTITLGDGEDVVAYNTVAQSDRDMDVITDFVSGTDQLNLSYNAAGVAVNWGAGNFVASNQFVGNYATFAQAQGALDGTVVSVVFQQDEQILWLDADANGTLDNNDFRVQLDGVTSVTAADLGFAAGNTITLEAPGAVVNATTMTNATDVSTNNDDTINTVVANLTAATNVDGLFGTDTLNVTDAITAPFDFNIPTIANVEVFNLTQGSTANVTAKNGAGIETNAGAAAIVTLGTGGQEFNGSADDDTLTLAAGAGLTDTADMGDGDDVVTGSLAGDSDVDLGDGTNIFNSGGAGDDTVTGGAGVDTFNFGRAGMLDNNDEIDGAGGNDILNATDTFAATDLDGVSNVETINLTLTAASVITSVNDLVAAGENVTINHLGGANALTFTGTAETDGAFTFNASAAAAADIITGGDGDDTFNYALNTGNVTLTGGDGDDTFNMGDNLTVADIINGGLGNDVLNVGDDSGLPVTDLDGVTNVETINIVNTGASTYQPAAGVIAAGETLTINAAGGGAAVTLDLANETDGRVIYTGTNFGDTLILSGANDAATIDTFTLGTGADTVDLVTNATNTVANLAGVDEVANFNVAGGDVIDVTNVGATLYAVNVDTAEIGDFVAKANAALAASGVTAAAAAAGDIFQVTVGDGGMAGTYVISNDIAGSLVSAADEIIQLTGTIGTITNAEFV